VNKVKTETRATPGKVNNVGFNHLGEAVIPLSSTHIYLPFITDSTPHKAEN